MSVKNLTRPDGKLGDFTSLASHTWVSPYLFCKEGEGGSWGVVQPGCRASEYTAGWGLKPGAEGPPSHLVQGDQHVWSLLFLSISALD